MQWHFCISEAPPRKLQAEDVKANSVWRCGWKAVSPECDPKIVQVGCMKITGDYGDKFYVLDIDPQPAHFPTYQWAGGHFESDECSFIVFVYRIGDKFFAQAASDAQAFEAGAIAAGGRIERCYKLVLFENECDGSVDIQVR